VEIEDVCNFKLNLRGSASAELQKILNESDEMMKFTLSLTLLLFYHH